MARLGTRGVGLSNPNSLAMWFGFCCVYFLVAGVEAKKNIVQGTWWLLAAACLVVVGVTVSRGPLLAIAIAGVVAFRRLLKRGFVPVLLLLVVAWAASMSGVFDQIVGFYGQRATEDTGRSRLWSAALGHFFNSPWIGVGASKAVMTEFNQWAAPHNGLLYIGLSSGVVPLVFFIASWMRSARMALRAPAGGSPQAAFQLPLFIYAFLEMLILDTVFMSAWHTVVLSLTLSTAWSRRVLRAVPARLRRRQVVLAARSGA